MNVLKPDKFNKRDHFLLKYYMNRNSIQPGDFEDDLLYFMDQYNTSITNGELFEKAFMAAFGMYYNTARTGVDGYVPIGNSWKTLEAKKERKSGNIKLDGKSMWSIHTAETLLKKANDPNFYLLQFGFREEELVYALLINVSDTEILKGKTVNAPSPNKMIVRWTDYQNSNSVYPLFLNKPLIKKYCGSGFKNWLLEKKECGKLLFKTDIRKLVNIPDDKPELYYIKGKTVTTIPKFPNRGHSCITITKSIWDNKIIPLKKDLCENEEKALLIGNDVLYIRNTGSAFEIRSSIDVTKTTYRPLDLDIKI